jgi:hypothetical protein
MWTVTHITTALIICSLLGSRISRKGKLLFSLGSLLPDLDHLYEPLHRFLFHNIFFLTASAIVSRSLPLTLGILLHFFEDALASNLNTLLYPLALIDLGLGLGWLYSAQFNIFIGAIYLLILVFKEGLISRYRDAYSWIRLLLAFLGIMSFAGARISEIFFGNVNLAIVECSRFLGSAVLMLSYFLHTPSSTRRPQLK